MSTRILVPQLDANTIDVTVTAWHKQPGDTITAGESIAEITTDKAAFELEAPASGTLLVVLAALKSVVPAGYILGIIGTSGETDPAAEPENAALLASYHATTGTTAPAVDAAKSTDTHATAVARVRATPKARRLAKQQGIDLTRVQAETGADVIDEAVLSPYLKP